MQVPIKPGTRLYAWASWRHVLLLIIVFGSLALVFTMQPIFQDQAYHDFGDRRAYFGIPNFFDVMSNLPFLFVGLAGMKFCWGHRSKGYLPSWFAFFAGVAMVSAGSGYYHLNPDNETLLWDRLPMTIALMGLFAALIAEYVNARLGRYILLPALLTGLSSVIYWYWSGDLRFYVWVQFFPLLTIPVLMSLFQTGYSHQRLLLVALACYMLAKLLEAYDWETFTLTNGLLSGHSLKHLLAALGCLSLLVMLRIRRLITPTR